MLDENGDLRSAETVADGLLQINNSLTLHQNQTNTAHQASAIGIDTTDFQELSQNSTNLQEVLDNIDDIEELNIGIHRATEHVSGVPKDARSVSFNIDGYGPNVTSSTPVTAHAIHSPPGTVPVDSVSVGDNVVVFNPDNSNYLFDAQFSQVQIGDIIRINYGNGIEDIRKIDSIRFVPGIEWVVRINGVNLRDTDGYTAYARIDKPLAELNTYGVVAVAVANATPLMSFSNILGSVIVADPRGACVVGIDFNASQINENHYNLYLELYPSGNPEDHVISLPAVDVSGNAGISPGKYTLESVVQNTNNKLREIGFNFRFIAFYVDNNFGIMLADAIDGASFAVISGNNSGGSLIEGLYTKNIIGNATIDNWDALGLGFNKANLASPAYLGTFVDSTAALLPTKVIHPLKRRDYIVNGKSFDSFKNKNGSTEDNNGYGYYPAEIISRTVTGTTVEVTYRIDGLLKDVGLKTGKTIVVQPSVSFSDGLYNDNDYGRFIIKEASFSNCSCDDEETIITVINGIHGFGGGVGFSSSPGLTVRIYIGEDSVSFNEDNLIDNFPTGNNYHRNFEIYIADNKTTFSHERARLPYQSETLNLLTTENWHINFVSQKLKGYKDASLSSFNKYIRFYVLRYDSVSGEYDGYIGKRASGVNIERTGPIVTGRKNVITRFYDETNIDYIDLEFVEISTTNPGLSILSSSAVRYVDIELFSSLGEDDELLKLATCEVNWEPIVGKNIIERVVDCRQRGSISEKEFTSSAVDFITSVPRSLNQNGVIRGFDFAGENSNVPGELFFNGGIVLVNGKIITINNGSCVIHQLTNESTPPQTVTWAVCVNSGGEFIAIPITLAKDQFYARNNITPGTNYYIPSVTFSELVNRKDLCLLATVTATVNSISVIVKDARKFVENESSNIPFTWVSDTVDELNIGNFRSYEALRIWLENFGNKNSYIKISGNFTYSSSLDFSGLNGNLVLDGNNATFNFSSVNGFVLGSNTTVRNITFNYDPTLYSGSNDINGGNGCLFSDLTGLNS